MDFNMFKGKGNMLFPGWHASDNIIGNIMFFHKL